MQPLHGFLDAVELIDSDEPLERLPQAPAVFLIRQREGRPYLGRTSLLRRRAMRLLKKRDQPSRLLNLRDSFWRLEYWLTGSALDAAMQLYELAVEHFPEEYARILRLRNPAYVKLLLANAWPRSMVTSQIGSSRALYFGPFRTRASAEAFESQFLGLFQIRRCQEDLVPSPEHPGCIYGEMNRCLRPCQQAVSPEEYAQEVARAKEFLTTAGQSLLRSISSARDRLSTEMEFEEAARQHQWLERVEEVLRLRDDLAGDIETLNAIAVARSAIQGAVDLFLLRNGQWKGSVSIGFQLEDGKPVSIDQKLREALTPVSDSRLANRERQDRLALLARWYHSSWRDGELISFTSWDQPPIRKLVNAISRIV